MYKLLAKRGQLFAFLLGLIVIAIMLLSVFGGIGEWNGLQEEAQKETSIFNFGLQASIGMTLFGAFLFFVTIIVGLITNPKGSLKMIIAFAIIGIIFAIFYGTAVAESSGIVKAAVDQFGLNDGSSKIITAGIKTTGLLVVIAFVTFVLTEIWNLFK